MFNPYFADISNNNDHFDARAYREGGHILVAIKASEGTGFVDPDHRGWCYAAGGHHIGIVHYHFARPDLGTSPEAEADHFLSVALPLAGGRDYLCVDQERATPFGWAHDHEWTAAFDARVQARSRFHTIAYASQSTIEAGDIGLVGDNKRLWVAAWGSGPDGGVKGYTVVFRQYTDGVFGPGPHWFSGIGTSDGNVIRRPLWDAIARHAR